MRKIILFIHSTFNGVVTGDRSKDKTNFMVWTTGISESGIEYLLKTLDNVDTILLGRGTYEDLARKWPTMNTSRLGEKINSTHKLVVTNSLQPGELKWGGFAAPEPLSGSNIEEQIEELKKGDGGDIIIFGSPTLVQSLANANLIDEYRIKVHPVVVNVGEHLFDNIKQQKNFRLLDVEAFEDDSFLITYTPQKLSPARIAKEHRG